MTQRCRFVEWQIGDSDGVGARAQLQHLLGVMLSSDGQLYIADSYNHKVPPGKGLSARI